MNSLPKTLIWLIIAAITTSFLTVYFALKPYIWESFNLSTTESANIGVTFSGITAPILTLLSIALLYLALRKQTESNDNQRLKNDADLIFLLYNQLETEYRETTTRQYQPNDFHRRNNDKTPEIFYGFDAFIKLCDIFQGDFAKDFAKKNESSKILFIIQSYKALEELISISTISQPLKSIIENKTYNFYISRIRDPLANLSFYIKENDDLESKEVVDFFSRIEKKRNPNFDMNQMKTLQELF